MATELSLFGGLAAVVLLFFMARFLKAGIELSGLIAAGVPLLAYLAVLFGQWPGLDVAAIHFSVFIVSAFVLVVFARYRARQQARMHWVPKALIGFFVLLAVINASLLYIATNGLPGGIAGLFLPGEESTTLHTGFSGTTRHGTDAAKSIGSDLSRQHHNRELGWQIRVEGLRQPTVGSNGLYISAEDRNGKPLAGLMGRVLVGRPGAESVSMPVKPVAPGQYEGRVQLLSPGLWLVELELSDATNTWKQSWEVLAVAETMGRSP